ncbi:MAG: hypothetical protein WD768_03345 [Phycisphaeraceae bacterium]
MITFAIDIYRPPLGETRTLLLIGAAALLAAWVYLRPRRGDPEEDALSMSLTWPQRGVLLLLRLLALAMLAWLLWGPTQVADVPQGEARPRIILLADTSASMAQKDVVDRSVSDEAVSRWAALRRTWLDPVYIERLRERSDLSLVRFDETLQPLALDDDAFQPAGRHTDLFAAALQATRLASDASPGLLVILSDGHDTRRAADPAAIEQLQREGWTIFGVPVGSGASVPDLAVTVWADADSLFPGQSTHLNATVSHVGFSGQAVQVELYHEDERIDSQRITLGDEPSQRLRFRITPASGAAQLEQPVLHAYRVVAQPIEGERVTENNQRFAFVQVQREHIRVALFEGQPYWDTRYLAKVLAEDAQVDLTAVYALGSERTITVHHTGGEREGGPAFAAADATHLTREQLNQFDVIILGKGAEAFFAGARAQLLVDFVQERGGSLILARGRAFDDTTDEGRAAQVILSKVEPVEWGSEVLRSLSLELTQAGRIDPLLRFDQPAPLDAIVTRLPDMIAATQVKKEKAATIVLLRQKPRDGNNTPQTPGMAAIAHVNAGKGKVLAVMTDGLWRWALLPSRLSEMDSVFQVFWSRTIRWLATGGEFLPGQSVSMQMSRLTTEPGDAGEAVSVTVATRYAEPGFKPVLRLIAPDGSAQTIALVQSSEQSAEYRASLRPQQAGVHRVELDAPGMTPARLESRLAVYDQSLEKLDPSARPQVLHAMSEATGGKCLDLSQREELFSMLESVQQARRSDQREEWAFAEPAVLAGILLLLGIEWFTRRRNGLL